MNNNSSNSSNNRGKDIPKNTPPLEILPVEEGPHSPYNFVRINNNVLVDPQEVNYSEISDKTYNGEIRYKITAKTPVYIDNGHGKPKKKNKNKDNEEEIDEEDKIPAGFFKNKDGQYAIPGSTMRGLIRSNVQILGMADVKDDIDDYNMTYREIAGGAMKDIYDNILGQKIINNMSVLENVKAGYIERKGNKYYIYPNIGDVKKSFKKGHPDYYVVSEKDVIEGRNGLDKESFDYILKNFHYTDGPFEKLKANGKELNFYEGKENKDYRPYWDTICYKEKNGIVSGVYKKEDSLTEGTVEGAVISSGALAGKKVFYIIPKIDDSEEAAIPISDADIDAYQSDFNHRKNTIDEDIRDFYALPEDGERRPVFYIDYDERLYFGYTPRLRLMYKNSIHNGLKQKDGHDFVKSMFGYQNGKVARKSKVFFTDAVLTGKGEELEEINLVLAEPKPTSYLEYLVQNNGNVKTYEDDEMQLRGIKQYWLHDKAQTPEPEKDSISSKMRPLDKGSIFEGTVRFQNLSKEELGLLIWAILLEPDSEMNIGMGKPYGYGRIKLDNVELFLTDPKSDYQPVVDVFRRNPLSPRSEDVVISFVDCYKEFAKNEFNKSREMNTKKNSKKNNFIGDIMDIRSIKEFFAMKSMKLSERYISYMSLSDYQKFKSGNNPLPEPLKIKSDLESDTK